MRIRLLGACAAVAVAIGLVGCIAEDPGPQTLSPEPSTSESATSVPTAPKPAQTFPPEQQPIVEAYYGYFDALFSLRTQTDDELRAVMSLWAVPERVEKLVEAFAKYRAAGKEPGGSPRYMPIEIVSASEQASTIVECHDGSQEVMVDVATGQEVDNGVPLNRLTTELILEAQTGRWLVSQAYWEVDIC